MEKMTCFLNQALYKDFLGEPGSGTAERILHTHYHKRDCYRFGGGCQQGAGKTNRNWLGGFSRSVFS